MLVFSGIGGGEVLIYRGKHEYYEKRQNNEDVVEIGR